MKNLNKRISQFFIVMGVIMAVDINNIALAGDDKTINTNRLIKEKSPYLLQHAHNPVDWYPWGEEAFKKAKLQNKPIMLSIGYSTCHWCHVMEQESFSNLEIAAIMNQYFVSIKVDREERPDIDSLYMTAVSSLTGSGGWPLTLFLTPEKKPFYGGTYFPPEDKWGSPGFKTILLSIANKWTQEKEEIINSSEVITKALADYEQMNEQNGKPVAKKVFKQTYQHFENSFDDEYGGFGVAPKFPLSHPLLFLLRYGEQTADTKAVAIVEKTLQKMAQGGIYDHLAGGFHRYSTDERWHVPHFEKMLYDQALLVLIYLEAYQATGKKIYTDVALDVLNYVLSEMTSLKGGFYSAFDADSLSNFNDQHKKEGAFYVWSKSEIVSILGEQDAEIFSYYFGVNKQGNVLNDPQQEFVNKNIFFQKYSLEETAANFKKDMSEITEIINKSRKTLLSLRSKRPKPHLDDKILLDWNALMISSFSKGYRVLNNPAYLTAARSAVTFILDKLVRDDGRLLHRYRDGESKILAQVDDYAFFIQALLDLYETTFETEYLDKALFFNEQMLELFWDKEKGGFYVTGKDAEALLIRQKKFYDGAIISGNSVAVLNLLRINLITLNESYLKKAEQIIFTNYTNLDKYPAGYTQLLIAFDFLNGPTKEIILSGDKNMLDFKEVVKSIYSEFRPRKIVIGISNKDEQRNKIEKIASWLKDYQALEGKLTVYVCKNNICNLPLTDLAKLKEYLE